MAQLPARYTRSFKEVPVRRLSILIGVALIAVSCGGGESGTTASTSGQFVDRVDVPTVVFDGTSCTYTGPETVDPGPVRMTLDNQSAIRVRIDVLKLPDDKSYDDVIAYVDSGEAEANQDSPDWVAQTRLVRAPANELITANRTLFGATFGILCYIGDTEPYAVTAVGSFDVLE